MALDTNDNCYVTGHFDDTNNFGGITLTNQSVGGSDIFVAKYNATGALQWAQRAGGTNFNNGRGIGVDTNGNVYVTGGVYGPANFGSINLPASSYENFFLAKYNSSGVVQWVQQSAGGVGNIYGTALAGDGAGNSYALMFVDNYQGGATLTFGSVNVPIPAQDGLVTILIKYNSTGTAQWAQLLGSSNEVFSTAIAIDTVGNVYINGIFEEDMEVGNSNLLGSPGATKNLFIAKFNNSGALTWIQQPQGGVTDGGGVAADPAGNVYVTGAFNTNLNFGGGIILTNTANSSGVLGGAFVARYNSSGVIQWAQLAGGTNAGAYLAVALDGQTNVYSAGVLNSQTTVAKYSPMGTLQWTYSANNAPASPVGSAAINCAVDPNGHCYLDGWYQVSATFGTNTLQPQETWNIFLAEVAPVLFLDNFAQFTNGTVLTSTNYIPASGPPSASVITSVQNGSPTITATNFLGNTWALFDNSVPLNKNQYEGILSSAQTNQVLQVTWKMWIQATNAGPGMFLLSVPTDDPTANYNPPIFFTDTGSIGALTNGTTPQTIIGNWGSLAGTVMTNALILNYPRGTFSYSLNGQSLATLPLGPYFTNVVGAIYFNGFERSAGSLGNRFAIADVMVKIQQPTSPPNLIITRVSPNNVVISWPVSGSYTLQSTTNLSPAVWSAVSPAPVVVNGQNTVTNAISGQQQFYRLSQ